MNKVKQIRLTANLTQMQLAKKCKVHNMYISNIERGKANPSVKVLRVLYRLDARATTSFVYNMFLPKIDKILTQIKKGK